MPAKRKQSETPTADGGPTAQGGPARLRAPLRRRKEVLMRKSRDLGRDLDRLVGASGMFASQEWERTTFGDDQDYDDAKQETHDVVRDVLSVLEKSMDEDLLERLDRGEYPRVASSWGWMPRFAAWSSVWPFYSYGYTSRGRRTHVPRGAKLRRNVEMLDQILDDFRADFESRLRLARRDDRSLSDAELEEALKELREDLKVVARRSRRREERREERDDGRKAD